MFRRKAALVLALGLAAAAAYACWPRKADLRSFAPAEMAHLETAMWRDYYDKRYPALFYHLYASSRTQFGFSPLDSVRVALSAMQAARTFQPTHSRSEAQAALPSLLAYYGLLREAAPVAFDVNEAARAELDWWQARREAVAPLEYGAAVARVAAITYGRPAGDSAILQFGTARAQAMADRDAHGEAITDADWGRIEDELRHAYDALKAAVARE